MANLQCRICRAYGAKLLGAGGDYVSGECVQCGAYRIAGSAEGRLEQLDEDSRARLSAWVRQFAPPTISFPEIEEALSAKTPGLMVRADAMLRFIAQRRQLGESFTPHDFWEGVPDGMGSYIRPVANPLLSVGWNRNEAQSAYMLRTVLRDELGWLMRTETNEEYRFFISPKGLLRLEQTVNADSAVGFCAMWFDEKMRPLYDRAIAPAIQAAGYEPFRIDSKEHANKIDDEIIASIRSARFVVADFTGNRGGVYYEAGFAHGIGLPVFFMAQEGEPIHFDVRQYNTIFWTENALADTKEQLKNRIVATIGHGPSGSL